MNYSHRNTGNFLLWFGVFLAVISAWRMSLLPLWSHWPLGLFGGLWLGLYGLLLRNYAADASMGRNIHLAALTGTLLGVSFLPLPFTGLIFIAWIPLFYLWHDLLSDGSSNAKLKVFWLSLFSFLGWNIWSTYWVANTALIPAVFAFVLNSFFMCWPVMLYVVIRRKISPNLRWAALVSFWLVFEFIHLRWEITWPWLTLGNTFAQTPPWIQWYSWTGVVGGSLWIWVANIYGYKAFLKFRTSAADSLKIWLKPILLTLGPILLGYILFWNYDAEGTPARVVVIQPNYEPHYEKFEATPASQLRRYLSMADTALTTETDYLILPETVFSSVELSRATENKYISSFQKYLDSFPDLAIIMGLSSYRMLDDSVAPEGDAVRTSIRGGDTTYWQAQNSVIEWDRTGVEEYMKSKLVPGPEQFPFSDLLFFLEPVIDQLGGTVAGLETQKEREVFSSEGREIAPVICYESVFGEFIGGYIRRGAGAIAVITNDGWWDNTPGHIQHMQYSSLRAIEYRRDVVRAANTGISCFIDQRGSIRKPTEYEETTVLKGELLFREGWTFYARWGDLISRLSIFALLVFLLNALSNHLMGKEL